MMSMKTVLTGTGVILISKEQYKEPLNVTKTVVSSSFVTPWTVAYQAPMPIVFSRREYWNGLPFPSADYLSNPGRKFTSPALAGGFFTTEPPKPKRQ